MQHLPAGHDSWYHTLHTCPLCPLPLELTSSNSSWMVCACVGISFTCCLWMDLPGDGPWSMHTPTWNIRHSPVIHLSWQENNQCLALRQGRRGVIDATLGGGWYYWWRGAGSELGGVPLRAIWGPLLWQCSGVGSCCRYGSRPFILPF